MGYNYYRPLILCINLFFSVPPALLQLGLPGTVKVKEGLAQMLKGGIIMDVVNAEQARIAEEAGACAVMALERVPADIRKDGGVARMADPKVSISLTFLPCASVPTLKFYSLYCACVISAASILCCTYRK